MKENPDRVALKIAIEALLVIIKRAESRMHMPMRAAIPIAALALEKIGHLIPGIEGKR